MADAPTTPRSPADAGGPDGLLATKLYLPAPVPGFVPRPRLVGRLEEGLGRGLTLVCAPAGSGKTALLADWARHRRPPVAWLSLDAGDNDPARFWRHAAAAVDRVRPGVAERLAPLLGPPAPPSFDGLAAALSNELAQASDRVLLVLDDYHLVEGQPVHASVRFLLEHRPPALHLLLASRADPPLPLARLRARGQLAEVRAADLRFSTEEAAAMLREAVGPEAPLPDAAVAALASRTEGWAAGLQLAGLSLRGQADVAGFVAAFSGSHRYVLDYLTEEVLERQPEPVRRFLLETSVLERLSGPLCDAVVGRDDGQRLLERVEQANLFLVPLDEVRGWWRYHHLFADLLRARLQRADPGRVPELHRAAAAWFERHGPAGDAVQHAVAAGEAAWAARLVERHGDEVLLRSEGATLERWLAALPAEVVASRPRLLLAQAILALVGGRVEAVQAPLDAAERAFAEAADEPFEPSVGQAASLLANVPAAITIGRGYLAELQGDTERAVMFDRRVPAQIGGGDWMLDALGRLHLAVAEWLRGRLPEAERAATASIDLWRAAEAQFLAVRGYEVLGRVQRAQGRLDAALQTYREALALAAGPGGPALPAAGIAHVGLAEVAYQRGDLDAALEHAGEGVGLCRHLTYTQALATGLATLAWARQAGGDPAGALEAMGEAERVAASPGVPNLLNPVPAQRARLLLAQGDLAGAARWTERLGLGPDDRPSYASEPEHLMLARVLVAQGRPGEALGLLERLGELAVAQRRTGSRIEVLAVSALALEAGGAGEPAVAALSEALTLACPQGYVRVFADEGAPMAGLVGRLVAAQRGAHAAASGVPIAYLGRLVRALERPGAAAGPGPRRATAAAGGLVEALSERELEVLRLLATGRSNQQLADELVVSLNTVKKHVVHVLDKLGAANRTEAIVRARELGLLD